MERAGHCGGIDEESAAVRQSFRAEYRRELVFPAGTRNAQNASLFLWTYVFLESALTGSCVRLWIGGLSLRYVRLSSHAWRHPTWCNKRRNGLMNDWEGSIVVLDGSHNAREQKKNTQFDDLFLLLPTLLFFEFNIDALVVKAIF